MQATTPIKRAGKQTGRYLYAIVAADRAEEFGPCGIDGGLVYTVSDGQLAAAISDLPNEKLRPERRRLAAHHEVLKRLLARGALLPMAFGIIADGPDAVARILARNRQTFAEQLADLQGKVEMGLRVAWDVPNIFEYFVSRYSELRALRDHLFWSGREPSQDDRIELGRQFDRLLTRERELQTESVVAALQPHCVEIKENKPRNEREIANLACLVRRDAQKEFEQGVFEAAKSFDHHYAFDFNGPWPPHNFVEVELQM